MVAHLHKLEAKQAALGEQIAIYGEVDREFKASLAAREEREQKRVDELNTVVQGTPTLQLITPLTDAVYRRSTTVPD